MSTLGGISNYRGQKFVPGQEQSGGLHRNGFIYLKGKVQFTMKVSINTTKTLGA